MTGIVAKRHLRWYLQDRPTTTRRTYFGGERYPRRKHCRKSFLRPYEHAWCPSRATPLFVNDSLKMKLTAPGYYWLETTPVKSPKEKSRMTVSNCIDDPCTVALRHWWSAKIVNYCTVAMRHTHCTGQARVRNNLRQLYSRRMPQPLYV